MLWYIRLQHAQIEYIFSSKNYWNETGCDWQKPSKSPWTNANIGRAFDYPKSGDYRQFGKRHLQTKILSFFPGCFFPAREYFVSAASLRSSWRQSSHPSHSFWFQCGWNYQRGYLVFLSLNQTHPQKFPVMGHHSLTRSRTGNFKPKRHSSRFLSNVKDGF